jgi:hypothetical protein
MQTWTPEEIADILDDAADYILDHGWLQGRSGIEFRDGTAGPRCVIGAVREAAWVKDLGFAAMSAEGALRKHLGLRWPEHVPRWNDNPDRHLDEVIEALQRTAKEIRTGDIVPSLWSVAS